MPKNDDAAVKQPDAPVADAPETPAPAAEAPAAEVPAAPAADEPAAEVPQAPLHLAYLDHDDPNASATHDNVPIVRGENGLFLAPLAFVEHLLSHGFRVVSEGKPE